MFFCYYLVWCEDFTKHLGIFWCCCAIWLIGLSCLNFPLTVHDFINHMPSDVFSFFFFLRTKALFSLVYTEFCFKVVDMQFNPRGLCTLQLARNLYLERQDLFLHWYVTSSKLYNSKVTPFIFRLYVLHMHSWSFQFFLIWNKCQEKN